MEIPKLGHKWPGQEIAQIIVAGAESGEDRRTESGGCLAVESMNPERWEATRIHLGFRTPL